MSDYLELVYYCERTNAIYVTYAPFSVIEVINFQDELVAFLEINLISDRGSK